MNKERKERLLEAIQRASESTQFALVLDARLAGEPVDLSAEHGGSGWRLGWRWDLGERTLDDVVKQVLPSVGELPQVGIADIRLRSIYAECFSGNDYKGLSFGIADLSFLYVKGSKGNEPPTLWGMVHEKPIVVPASGVVATLIGKGLTLSDLRIGQVAGFTPDMRRAVIGQLAQARLLLDSGGSGFVAGIAIGAIGAKPIAVPAIGQPAKKTAGSSAPSGSAVSTAGGGSPTAAVDSADGMRKWFVVGKTIGPLRLGRVGCEWKDGKIGLLLDSAVDVGGLHLGLTGLCVRLPPSDPRPANLEWALDGIDLAYRGGADQHQWQLSEERNLARGRENDPVRRHGHDPGRELRHYRVWLLCLGRRQGFAVPIRHPAPGIGRAALLSGLTVWRGIRLQPQTEPAAD
jgi:hypothetical protein